MGAPLTRGARPSTRVTRGMRGRRLCKVGWIFTQGAAERDYIMNSEEIQQMAAIQDEVGPTAVTVVVSVAAPEDDEEGPSIHFEVRLL